MPLPILRPYQKDLKSNVHQQWNAGAKNVVMRLDTGGGKCLGKGTPILMYDGSIKAVELVKSGDLLLGPDSKPRRVLTTCTGREELFRVDQKNGDSYVVNRSHVLSLKQTPRHKTAIYPSQIFNDSPININVSEYLSKSKRWRHFHKGWKTAVDFPETELDEDMPAYFLGVLLGDGHTASCSVTTMDGEISDYIKDLAARHEYRVRIEDTGNRSKTYHLVNQKGDNKFRRALKRLGISKQKSIPHAYKTASRQNRLDLLAGLLDTDGSYTGKGYDFINKSFDISYGVAFIARSLGFRVSFRHSVKSAHKNHCGVYWRVCISGHVEKIPCRIERKKAAPRKQIKNPLVTGISLTSLGEGEYYGFELDGDGLFMLGDFTVTHNTAILSEISREHQGHSRIIAHRQELVGQLSIAVARNGVRHNVIASDRVRRAIAKAHVEEIGYSLIDANARCVVGSIDTMLKREDPHAPFVTLWIVDEGHHVVEDNKWHRQLVKYTHPDCRGLLPTATPLRADGKGLGRWADGVADVMVEGPPMRWLIEQGFLCDYRIFCPPSDLQLLEGVAASGDWSNKQLREAAKKSHIVGDVVSSYLKYGTGKLGITFSTDVETAAEMARAYKAAGVRAECLTGNTDDDLRRSILRQFSRREIDQIVAVDIISEGFDLPAVEVASFARPTESLALYMQQFGRALRPLEGKDKAIIIDHAGNVVRHSGPPDKPRIWSLDRRDKRGKKAAGDEIPLKVCVNCFGPFEAFHKACPHCGHEEPPASRNSPKAVDGDLTELDPAILAQLRGDVSAVDMSIEDRRTELIATGLPHMMVLANINRHAERQAAQTSLRRIMAMWGGYRKAEGMDDSMIQRAFYHRFGISVIEAVALGTKDAQNLTQKILKGI